LFLFIKSSCAFHSECAADLPPGRGPDEDASEQPEEYAYREAAGVEREAGWRCCIDDRRLLLAGVDKPFRRGETLVEIPVAAFRLHLRCMFFSAYLDFSQGAVSRGVIRGFRSRHVIIRIKADVVPRGDVMTRDDPSEG